MKNTHKNLEEEEEKLKARNKEGLNH